MKEKWTLNSYIIVHEANEDWKNIKYPEWWRMKKRLGNLLCHSIDFIKFFSLTMANIFHPSWSRDDEKFHRLLMKHEFHIYIFQLVTRESRGCKRSEEKGVDFKAWKLVTINRAGGVEEKDCRIKRLISLRFNVMSTEHEEPSDDALRW